MSQSHQSEYQYFDIKKDHFYLRIADGNLIYVYDAESRSETKFPTCKYINVGTVFSQKWSSMKLGTLPCYYKTGDIKEAKEDIVEISKNDSEYLRKKFFNILFHTTDTIRMFFDSMQGVKEWKSMIESSLTPEDFLKGISKIGSKTMDENSIMRLISYIRICDSPSTAIDVLVRQCCYMSNQNKIYDGAYILSRLPWFLCEFIEKNVINESSCEFDSNKIQLLATALADADDAATLTKRTALLMGFWEKYPEKEIREIVESALKKVKN